MAMHLVVLCLVALIGIIVTTGLLGRFWRFVQVHPAGHAPHRSPARRLTLRGPGPNEIAEQRAVRARLDAPFAAVFLGLSLVVLATPGFDNAWAPMFLLWALAAAVRWIETGPAASFARLGIVILLVLEALLVLGIHGGGALPQAGAYVALALVGMVLLYRADELPLSFGPREPGGNLPPRRRPMPTRAPSHPPMSHSLYDTLPITRQHPVTQATPTTRTRRNPLRVREDEGTVVSPPYYPQPTMQAGD